MPSLDLRTFLPIRNRSFLVILLVLLAAGCGQKDKSRIPVAKVGDHTITLDYFERKMNSMKPEDLPPDIATFEGKQKLLETMIDKEVMAIKAEQLGYGSDKAIEDAAQQLAQFKAVKLMKDDMVKDLSFIPTEEAQEYYQNLKRVLQISYMLFDHREEAEEARKLVEGGEKWTDVAARMNAGDPGPTNNWTMQLHYGTIVDDVEKPIFELQVGEISQPIESVYGYFLIRLDGESVDRKVPPFEELEDKIVQSIHERDVALKTVEKINEVLDKYHFHMDEDVLQIAYDALPEDRELVPVPPKEEWGHLDIKPADMDKVLMSWDGAEGEEGEVWDLRRFYDYYEATPWLGRPRRENRLGGLRRHLKEIAVRQLMPIEARARGYFDRPEVLDEVRERKQQAMITTLHKQLISADVNPTEEDIEAYWEQNKEKYWEPETREGMILVSRDSAAVAQAYERARSGKHSWDKLVKDFADAELMPKGGDAHFGPVGEKNEQLFTPLLWAQEKEGEVCEPQRLENGAWGIGRLETIHPSVQPDLPEVSVKVKTAVEKQISEKLFQEKMKEWRNEIEIKTYPKNLRLAVYQPQTQEKRAQGKPAAGGAATR